MNRAEKAALQLQAVAVLRMLKETRTYEELATATALPAGDLNRYVNGHVLPGADRASEIVEGIGREALADELRARVHFDAEGYAFPGSDWRDGPVAGVSLADKTGHRAVLRNPAVAAGDDAPETATTLRSSSTSRFSIWSPPSPPTASTSIAPTWC